MPKKRAEKPDELNTLTQATASRVLGVSREAVRLWIGDGKLTAHMVEGLTAPRLLRSDVEAFKKKRARAS